MPCRRGKQCSWTGNECVRVRDSGWCRKFFPDRMESGRRYTCPPLASHRGLHVLFLKDRSIYRICLQTQNSKISVDKTPMNLDLKVADICSELPWTRSRGFAERHVVLGTWDALWNSPIQVSQGEPQKQELEEEHNSSTENAHQELGSLSVHFLFCDVRHERFSSALTDCLWGLGPPVRKWICVMDYWDKSWPSTVAAKSKRESGADSLCTAS